MLFNSFVFAAFAPLAFAGHFLLRGAARRWWLVVASWIFYGWANPWYVLLLWASTILDFFVGQRLGATDDPRRRRLWITASLVGNLGLLAVFKYTGFFARAGNDLMAALGLDWSLPVPELVLPVGISFYTFQTLSYSIDVYRRQLEPERDFSTFALYVAFFPQLVAGPIERATHLIHQLRRERKHLARPEALDGLGRVFWGLTKKVVFADWFSVYVEQVFSNVHQATPLELFLGINAFAFQIYLDFSAYSDIAIGLGRLLGVELMENFRWPYLARNIAEFWHRWHISLSTWLRDYLYIPLGGSRRGRWKTVRNVFIVMFLGGLWHGANYTYVVWGLWIGAALALHRLWSETLGKTVERRVPAPVRVPLAVLATYVTMLAAWVFFRAPDLGSALDYFAGFGGDWADVTGLDTPDARRTMAFLAVAVVAHLARGLGWVRRPTAHWPTWAHGVFWGLLVTAMALLHAPVGEKFIYFQF